MTNPSVRLRQIPEAGITGIVFALAALLNVMAVGIYAAEGEIAWTAGHAAVGLLMLYWLQGELEEVSA
jgi:hypothetical protein